MSWRLILGVFLLSFGGAFILASVNQPAPQIEKDVEGSDEAGASEEDVAEAPKPTGPLALCIQDSMDEEGHKSREEVTKISCQGANVSDLSALEGLVKLEGLYLQDNALTSLESLPELPKLRTISVANNKELTSLKGIEKLVALEELQANKSSIKDLSGVETLSELKIVGLMMNDLEDVSAFEGLENLEDVTLNYNNITDISAFAGKPKLREFTVYSNAVSDISPLFENTKLRQVGLRGKGEIDCAQVAQLKSVLAEGAKVWGPKACDAPDDGAE